MELMKRSSFFIKNGSELLEEFIGQWGGRIKTPLRNYSSKELAHTIGAPVTEDGHYRIYRGSFGKNQILIKKYISPYGTTVGVVSDAVRDIVISSQMSFHKNVLKLIGYCLDYEYPALVYESPETCECLKHHLLNTKLTWKSKLSLALNISCVLAYLHTGFHTPVIHRGMKLGNFVIDKYGTAKFADFSFCISIPLGESHVEDELRGTLGYIEPAYFSTGVLTEKTDVYNFGLVFVELLTNRKLAEEFLFEKGRITRDYIEFMVNGDMMMEGETGRNEEVQAIATLAMKCIGNDRESRPEMVDIAKQLRGMLRSARTSSTS